MNEATKICITCKQEKDIKAFSHSAGYTRSECRTCRALVERLTLRAAILGAYGCKCACCGESHPYFLTLDHINNDGNVDRETLKDHQIYAKAKREGFPKDKYQLLCWNCNLAKAHYGKCPHQQ